MNNIGTNSEHARKLSGIKEILASEDQKKGGWTIAPEVLEELQNKIGMYEDAPSLEGIELVLLAYHNLPLPKSDK